MNGWGGANERDTHTAAKYQDLRSHEYLLRVVAEPDSPEHRDGAWDELLRRLRAGDDAIAALSGYDLTEEVERDA